MRLATTGDWGLSGKLASEGIWRNVRACIGGVLVLVLVLVLVRSSSAEVDVLG